MTDERLAWFEDWYRRNPSLFHACELLQALKAEREHVEELKTLLCRIKPYIDSIVCYASTCDEYEGNALIMDLKAAIK